MNAAVWRLFSCVAAVAVTGLIFPYTVNVMALLWATLMLFLLYTLLRPLLLLLALPLNMLLFGLLTPLGDALLLRWTVAWVHGLNWHYWQCLVAAIIISILYWPYSLWKKRRLQYAS